MVSACLLSADASKLKTLHSTVPHTNNLQKINNLVSKLSMTVTIQVLFFKYFVSHPRPFLTARVVNFKSSCRRTRGNSEKTQSTFEEWKGF